MSVSIAFAWQIYREEFVDDNVPAELIGMLEKVFYAGAQSVILSIEATDLDTVRAELEADHAMRVIEQDGLSS